MSTKNNKHRRNNKKRYKPKNPPPVGLITMGLGVVLIGVAALFLIPKAESAGGAPEEYSSIPMDVDFAAPDLDLENLAGEPESLTDYHGQVVLLNLWATWCPPCTKELPILQEYYEDHHEDGFVILGVDSQEKREVVESFLKTETITYPIWIDEQGKAGDAFNSISLPTSFVIDREGTVRLAWTGAISKAMLEKHVTPVIEQ